MLMWYFVDGVLILKRTVSPAWTLVCVAKPWIVRSPARVMPQSEFGVPGFEFSHAIRLVTGGSHAAAAAGTACATTRKLVKTAVERSTDALLRNPCARPRFATKHSPLSSSASSRRSAALEPLPARRHQHMTTVCGNGRRERSPSLRREVD